MFVLHFFLAHVLAQLVAPMSEFDGHRSKAGGLKQINKTHKAKFRTKGAIDATNNGRVAPLKSQGKAKHDHRQDRRNKAKQARISHRQDATLDRLLSSAPFFVAIIDSCHADNHQAQRVYEQLVYSSTEQAPSQAISTFAATKLKRSITACVAPRNIQSVMELAKIADTVLFVVSAGSNIDDFGVMCENVLCAQGTPTVAHVLVDADTLPIKRRNDWKKAATKEAQAAFPDTKVHTVDGPGDYHTLAWSLVNQKKRIVRYRDVRSHLLAEQTSFEPAADESSGTLIVSGYVRGRPWNVNRLVYVPGFGAYQIAKVVVSTDPCSLKRKDTSGEGGRSISPSPDAQESLESEIPIDPMAAEQTWPTEDELKEADRDARIRLQREKGEAGQSYVRAPKGTSSYQAAWIAEGSDQEDGEDEDGKHSGMDDTPDDAAGDMDDDNADLWKQLQKHDDGVAAGDDELEMIPLNEDAANGDQNQQYDETVDQEYVTPYYDHVIATHARC